MEHPVPQNVTTFEFHLVGDMTLKQFGFLALGLGVAYFAFLLLFPVNAFLASPIILFSTILGIAFAFVPILDRPLDHWLRAFLRAVYSPTFAKASLEVPVLQNRLQIYLNSLSPQPFTPPTPPVIPPRPLNISPIQPAPAVVPLKPPVPTPPPPPLPPQANNEPMPVGINQSLNDLPTDLELNRLVEMARQVQEVRTKIGATEQQIIHLRTLLTTPQSRANLSQDQLKQVFTDLQALVGKTENLYQQSNQTNKITPQPIPTPVKVMVEAVKPVIKQPQLTTFPNVINGIVTDEAGNFLEGVIVIIHDKNGLPVRAIKTNKLGQFAGATPLPLGVYSINLEKEEYIFDNLQVNLTGEVLAPLPIVGKKGSL